jgi:flavin-dependent dehydrogenase
MKLLGEEEGRSYAVQRSKLDAFLLEQAQVAGAQVIHNRVTGIEIYDQEVLLYSEGENCRAAVVVGAFGLDDGTCKVFEQGTPYRQPDFLNTIITRLHPGAEFLQQVGPTIQAFLLSLPGMEFGAVTPKADHLAINIAGREVSSEAMLRFLRSAPVQRFLPPHQRRENPLHYFRGKFPIAPAQHLYGDRYVMIGDAAGLIRPFKGKGINSACLTGIFAANCILNHGVTRRAFHDHFMKDCEVFTRDLPYGRLARLLVKLAVHFRFMDHVLKIGKSDPVFMRCLFDSVTGHRAYRDIFIETVSVSLTIKFAVELFRRFFYPAVKP